MNMEAIMSPDAIVSMTISLIIGGVISYFITKNTRNKKSLSFDIIQRGIVIETKVNGSELGFPFEVLDKNNNKPLDSVYCLVVRIWNNGTEAIKREDLSSKTPLQVSLEDNVNVIGDPIIRSNQEININLYNKGNNVFAIDFEYLNPKEWAIFEFYISNNPKTTISLDGRICNVSLHNCNNLDDSKTGFINRISNIFVILFLLSAPISFILLIYWGVYDYGLSILNIENLNLPTYVRFVQGICASLLVFLISLYIHKLFTRIRNPKDFPLNYSNSQTKNLWVILKIALTGKNYRLSNSVHDLDEITIVNSRKDN